MLCISGFIGIFFARLLMNYVIRSMYNKPFFIDSAPEGNYEFRLLCSYMKTPSFPVSGFLYIGKQRFTFVPHSIEHIARSFSGFTISNSVSPFSVDIISEHSVQLVPPILNSLQKLLFPRLTLQVEITVQENKWTFRTPQPHRVSQCLRTLFMEDSNN